LKKILPKSSSPFLLLEYSDLTDKNIHKLQERPDVVYQAFKDRPKEQKAILGTADNHGSDLNNKNN
jgi:hypothetical protein